MLIHLTSVLFFIFFFFFFSSRRRHTRSLRDWSSDVCTSDLVAVAFGLVRLRRFADAPAGYDRISDARSKQSNRPERVVIAGDQDRKSTRLNSSHVEISYAVFCLKKKKKK